MEDQREGRGNTNRLFSNGNKYFLTEIFPAASNLQLVEEREADCEQRGVPGGVRGVPGRVHGHPPDLQDSDARRRDLHLAGREQERE